jgi:solute carrier family 30 (zinc transporter), member 5/7
MQGIFLHILADALGSVAVIFSTLLTKYNSWHGWDPLASCAIAILIFFSAIPLVKSSGKRLLLALPDEIEYEIRGVLQGIGQLRGVVGYAGVRFWIADAEGGGHGHDHGHGHSHQGHVHDHEHDNGYSHGHDHDHLTYTYTHDGLCKSPNTAEKKHRVLGNMHIIAARDACLVEVNKRVAYYLKTRGFEIVLHIEREGDKACWCGGKKP